MRDRNIILYGGCESSDIGERLLQNTKLKFSHGLLDEKNKEVSYNISSSQIGKIREQRRSAFGKSSLSGAAGNWIIVDRFEERVIHIPVQNKDKTYFEDSAIITYLNDYIHTGRDILSISGTREIGTLFGGIFLNERGWSRELHESLFEFGVKYDEPFQAVIKFKMNKYKSGIIPSRNLVANAEVVKIYKLE
jgi:hypothetical protein